jgi:hypothetical protein
MAVERHVIAAVRDDEQQSHALQPVGVHTRPKYGARTFAPRAVSIITPFSAPRSAAIGARLLIAGRHLSRDRPRQLAAQLIEALLRVDRKILQHPREIGDQGFDGLLLALQPRELLIAALTCFVERGKSRGAFGRACSSSSISPADVVLEGLELGGRLVDSPRPIPAARNTWRRFRFDFAARSRAKYP